MTSLLLSTLVDAMLLVVFLSILNGAGTFSLLGRSISALFSGLIWGFQEENEKAGDDAARRTPFSPTTQKVTSDSAGIEDDDTDTTLDSDDSNYTDVREPNTRTSSSSSSSSSSWQTRRVRFTTVNVRNYDMVSPERDELSSLDWSFNKERQVPVELFERTKSVSYTRKSHTRRKISGTPVSGPRRPQNVAPRKRRVPKVDTSFPNIQQFDALLAS